MRVKMPDCTKCHKTVQHGDVKKLHDMILCEDCYVYEIVPKMPGAHYDNHAEFMNRLKTAYSVRKQQYH
jgi:hypothetical protein